MRELRLRGRRVRVLHVGKFYPPYKGGMESHLRELCRAISGQVDVSVLVSSSSRKTNREFDGDVPIERTASWAKLASAPICPGMIGSIRKTSADIVHLHCPNPSAMIAYLMSGHRGPLVVTYHSDIIRQRVFSFAYDPCLFRVLDRADAIICFSPNYRDSSKNLLPFREKCRVIPHGIDLRRFENADEGAVREIRERFGHRIVLGVGRLVYYKGFEYLVRAIRETDATLLIIGAGPLHDAIVGVARECGVQERVHLVGEVDDVVPYYRAARVFAMPSIARSEAFGIAQVEAMTCGTPVVNTSLDTGVPFVSPDLVSGLTVRPKDPKLLGQALGLLLEDDNLRAKLSAGAQRRVQDEFTVEKMAESTLQLYGDILDVKSATSIEDRIEVPV